MNIPVGCLHGGGEKNRGNPRKMFFFNIWIQPQNGKYTLTIFFFIFDQKQLKTKNNRVCKERPAYYF